MPKFRSSGFSAVRLFNRGSSHQQAIRCLVPWPRLIHPADAAICSLFTSGGRIFGKNQVLRHEPWSVFCPSTIAGLISGLEAAVLVTFKIAGGFVFPHGNLTVPRALRTDGARIKNHWHLVRAKPRDSGLHNLPAVPALQASLISPHPWGLGIPGRSPAGAGAS
jgi:hypothetical protein